MWITRGRRYVCCSPSLAVVTVTTATSTIPTTMTGTIVITVRARRVGNPNSNRDHRLRIVAVCRVNRGKVKLDALLSEGHTRAWQCKYVPLIRQRLHVDLLDTRYPVG